MNLKTVIVVPCSQHSDASLEEVDDSIIAHNVRPFSFCAKKRSNLYARFSK